MSDEQPAPRARKDDDRRIGRRDLLRRTAVAGGVAWSVPIVQMFTSPAFGHAEGSSAPDPHGGDHGGSTPEPH